MNPATRIVVSLISGQPPLVEQLRAAAQAGADAVELRVDLIDDPDAIEAVLRWRQSADDPAARLPVVVTVRGAAEGGAWERGDDERVALLERFGLLLPGFVDAELALWDRSANLRQKLALVARCSDRSVAGAADGRPRNELILSRHELSLTPDPLAPVVDALCAAPVGVVKLACMGRDARDAVRMLRELRRVAPGRAILLSMGPAATGQRVLARKFGARAVFAALSEHGAAAPGQPTVHELRELFGWERIGTATGVFGLVGWPVGHSRSPHVHNAALRMAGIDATYVPFPVMPGREALFSFLDLVAEAEWLGLRGLSVTLPHKEHALEWLRERGAEVSARRTACGAVNTLRCDANGHWSGENTDVAAIEQVLGGAGVAAGRAAVLGAGGVARAAVAALRAGGWSVCVYNRTAARAEALAAEFGCRAAAWEARESGDEPLVVNCTQLGMHPDVDSTPLTAGGLRGRALVMDTVYNPVRTRLLREASAAGCAVLDGRAMFLAQAEAQFQFWHGRPAPAGVMAAAIAR